jgi:glycosyltransferase involved in cell wall biosynthesis
MNAVNEAGIAENTAKGFRIFCLCVVKNEADIIEYCLSEASHWASRIFVMDNGSNDGTWEKVLAMANDRIVPWKTNAKPFTDVFRRQIFRQFRHEASTGDWWCRLDADEFYIDNPTVFLSKVPLHEHVVWGIPVEYQLTHEDVASLDFSQPVKSRLDQMRYYTIHNSEARFFRHRPGLRWPDRASWPRHMGLVHHRRILYKHYKYRSPEQIQKRLVTRLQAVDEGFDMWWKSYSGRWEEVVGNASECSYDRGSGRYEYDPSALPTHLEANWKRMIKRFLHGSGWWP